MSVDLPKTLKLDTFFSLTLFLKFFDLCIMVITLFFFHGALRPQKKYGLLGTGKSWFSLTDLYQFLWPWPYFKVTRAFKILHRFMPLCGKFLSSLVQAWRDCQIVKYVNTITDLSKCLRCGYQKVIINAFPVGESFQCWCISFRD